MFRLTRAVLGDYDVLSHSMANDLSGIVKIQLPHEFSAMGIHSIRTQVQLRYSSSKVIAIAGLK